MLARQLERVQQLQASTAALADVRSVDAAADVAVDLIAAEIGASAALLALRAGTGERLVVVHQRGFADRAEPRAHEHTPSPQSPVALAMGRREVIAMGALGSPEEVFVAGTDRSPAALTFDSGDDATSDREEQFASVVIPLLADEQPTGVAVYRYLTPRACTVEDRGLLMALGRQIGSAVARMRLWEADRATAAAAERAHAAKSRLVASISHEFRTPLGAIAGYAHLLTTGVYGALTSEQTSAIERITRSERYLVSLVNQALTLARLETGHIEYAVTDVVVQEAADVVMAMIEPQRSAKRQTLLVNIPADAVVRADAEKFQQILLNLLSNAVKFTPGGGRIVVDVPPNDMTPSMLLVRVTDSGIGIPADQQESIFEPFVQLRPAMEPADGVGLGLAISRELARGMGGELGVESGVGMGATFELLLPRFAPATR